jgi:hypothetical protein
MNATLSSLQAAVFAPGQAPTIKMPHAAGQATADDSPVLQAAIGLAEQIRAASEEIERGRRLPPRIAAAMKNAGVFIVGPEQALPTKPFSLDAKVLLTTEVTGGAISVTIVFIPRNVLHCFKNVGHTTACYRPRRDRILYDRRWRRT